MEEIIVQQKNDVQCVNNVMLTGSVVHKYRPRNDVIILTVAVKGKDIHDADYPNVAFYGESVANAIDKSIIVEGKDYPRVRILGSIQTTRKQTDDGVQFFMGVVGNSISRTQTMMEQLSGRRGLGSRKAESENDVCLLGPVTRVFPIPAKDGSPEPIGAIVTVRTTIDGRVNFPRFTCFGAQRNRALALKPGDVVCAIGFMETQNRDNPDNTRARFESIIATEIDIVKE